MSAWLGRIVGIALGALGGVPGLVIGAVTGSLFDEFRRAQWDSRTPMAGESGTASAPLSPQDCYDILGVSPTATPTEVRRAYRTLAARFHPDADQGLSDLQRQEYHAAFIRVQSAWHRLQEHSTYPV